VDEKARIDAVYRERKSSKKADFYSLLKPGNLFMAQSKERSIREALNNFPCCLSECRVLDVGCGFGHELRNLLRFGALPENLCGIDLISERVEEAKKNSPNLDLREGDAKNLPWPDGFFHVVMQSTVFSSILDRGVQEAVAREMLRVLRPGGIVLWYDMRMTDPRNPNLVPMGQRRVRGLFEGCRIDLKSHTLNPWLARPLAKRFRWACELLEAFPPLRSHLFGLFEKKEKIER
jgi:SAM-dependent methyltransferase